MIPAAPRFPTFVDRRLYLLFTPTLCVAEPWQTLRDALVGGVDLVQIRESRPTAATVRRCIEVCGEHGVPVIVNDHVDLAVESGAFGAHVGQGDLPAAEARQRLAGWQVLGVSTRNLAQIERAVADGADHVGFGPMFPTSTKGYDFGQSDDALRDALATSPLPVWPIGGIDPANVARLVRLGARRAAVSGAILRAGDPRGTARALCDALTAE